MLAKRIIPCLDVTNGRVVKGVNFVDLIDAGDPVECAIAYNEQEADELVFLDITASSDARETMVDVVRRTAEKCFIPLTVGGGISLYFLVWWLTGHGLRVRPMLVLGLVFIIVAFQMISLGLIAELVVAGHRPDRSYRIARRV